MKFTVIPAPSPYNIILGLPGLRKLKAIPSTIHRMMKFPTSWGIATLVSQTPTVFECRTVGKKQAIEIPKEATPQEKISNPVTGQKKGDGSWECAKISRISHDACKGYHQVQMAEEDEEKTMFYTDQAYVDDMVVKSKSEREMLAYVAETFDNLRRINMKLNLKKCPFEVEEGILLGYMVTSEGIRANPTKTKDIEEMQSPRIIMEYLTLKNSRPLPDFEEYVVSTSADTSYMILWSAIKRNTFSANTSYPKNQYSVSEEPILRKREHEEMKIFIKEFRITNELLLKERSNLLSELKIEPHDDGVENKSLSNPERTTQPLVKPQQSSIPFPNRVRKEKEEALQRKFLGNLKQLDINILFIEAIVQIPKYAKYLKNLLTNKSGFEEACTETMNEKCSADLLNKLPSKEKDTRSFTTTCQVLEKHKKAKDLAANHLSRFENAHMEVLTEREIADKFFNEHLMMLKSKFNNNKPWYANFVNYIVGKVVPLNWTFEKRNRFFSKVKTYFWEDPYAFKLCVDNIMRRCEVGSETLKILAHRHSGPTGGYHSANVTAKKVYKSRFYWPSVFKDDNEYVRQCDACQRSGNISSRNEMPQNNIQVCEVFDVWGLDFMGPFP
ncbi:reverse transcriptase domain-containing protein [Tanacetum coccineum]